MIRIDTIFRQVLSCVSAAADRCPQLKSFSDWPGPPRKGREMGYCICLTIDPGSIAGYSPPPEITSLANWSETDAGAGPDPP